jgi:hypothetical protein
MSYLGQVFQATAHLRIESPGNLRSAAAKSGTPPATRRHAVLQLDYLDHSYLFPFCFIIALAPSTAEAGSD